MNKFGEWLKKIFSYPSQKVETEFPTNVPVVEPAKVETKMEPPKPTNEEVLRDWCVRLALEDIDEAETHGKNRSPMIDALNKKVGQPLGTAYCASWLTIRVYQRLCDKFALKNPLGITAGSQSIAARAAKWKRPAGVKARQGDAHVEQRYDKPSNGHTGLVCKDQTDAKLYACIDGNSNQAGDHDGEGVDALTRSTDGDKAKKHLGFYDVIGWIMQANQLDANAPFGEKVKDESPKQEWKTEIVLDWEAKDSSRAMWSKFLYRLISQQLLTQLDKAADVEKFNPNYRKWTPAQKSSFWCILICAMAKHESNWRNDCRYIETTMGIDPLTKRQVASEGLLQLSYQDSKNYDFAKAIDWNKDRNLADTDPRKTIFDPYINLEVGARILAYLVEKHGWISKNDGSRWRGGAAYWSVLRSKKDSFNAIVARTQSIKF